MMGFKFIIQILIVGIILTWLEMPSWEEIKMVFIRSLESWNRISIYPYTRLLPWYQFLDDFGNPDVDFDYTTVNGEPSVLYGDLNSNRLPTYHRLDASLKYTTRLESGTFELTFGATNVYNRENIFFYDRVAAERVNQLPIMPTISASFAF